MREVYEGLKILIKYCKNENGEENGSFSAEHHVIYAGPSEDNIEVIEDENGEGIKGSVVSKADRKTLDKLGWFIDQEFNCWAKFV